MPKYSENNVSAHFDEVARKYFGLSKKWAEAADKSSENKARYLALSRKYSKKASDALESAKAAAQKK